MFKMKRLGLHVSADTDTSQKYKCNGGGGKQTKKEIKIFKKIKYNPVYLALHVHTQRNEKY